ncbi:hypothetical protein [Lyngbya sp. PCC 8106]|uniref:hypothetical protein n=1 Tax=Lyngbya sp. (strain PCC 8106) TaxID=313612 RepID=UPI0000EA9EFB|nr:hypothetical protein [Lyngbya sp. PCC 8106]EAW39010.1 hypothetical protein L8106_01807 [Lyngbya sp. PCC 8106]
MEINLENKVYLQIGFRSPEPSSQLKTIELFGVPGQKNKNGNCTINEKIQQFFDDLIVRDLFRRSSRLSNCSFTDLKIWLYDEDNKIRQENVGYRIPTIDHCDVLIPSHSPASKLKKIYVLDNELKGEEREEWLDNSNKLFKPLFGNFIVPPEKLEIVTNVIKSDRPFSQVLGSFVGFVDKVSKAGDPYVKMKKELFFNALIIQID